jgi:hypothetical protein
MAFAPYTTLKAVVSPFPSCRQGRTIDWRASNLCFTWKDFGDLHDDVLRARGTSRGAWPSLPICRDVLRFGVKN